MIKILLSFIFLCSLAYSLLRPAKNIFSKMFLILGSLLGLLSVIGEKYTIKIANYLGVGRGTDLFLYLGLVIIFFFIFYTLDRFSKIQKDISKLTRIIAIHESKKNKND